MVDMSGRLKMKIVHEEYTSEDEREWEYEIEEINKSYEEHIKKYEDNLKKLLESALSDSEKPQKNADYFIDKYSDRFIGRNSENIKNRLELYKKYLLNEKEQEK